MSKNIFKRVATTNSDSDVIDESAEKDLFIDWENPRTGQSFKMLNLEHDSLAPREGIIELKPINITKRHENNAGFRLISDKRRDCFIGIPVTFDHKDGKAIFQKISISNFETYDLSIPAQRQEWICVKNCPYYTDVINGEEQNHNFDAGTKSKFKAIDKEREANMFVRQVKLKRNAEDIAEVLLDTPKELEEVALMLGKDPKAMSLQRLWAEVYKDAQNKPDDFMRVYKSETKHELAVLKRGLLTGELTEHRTEGINFNGLTLGFREDDAVRYLKEHPSTLAAIDALSRKKDKETKDVMKPRVAVTSENAKELALKKENEELRARLDKLNEDSLNKLSDKILDKVDPEFAELLEEAKRLDVRGAHNMKSKEKLREKIEEKKKLGTN